MPKTWRKAVHHPSEFCWATTFGVWVGRYGVERLAADLGVVPHTVYHWIHGRAIPRHPMMVRIIGLSNGLVTANDLFAHIAVANARSCKRFRAV